MPKQPNKVPAFSELMWPVLTALKGLGGSATNEELLARVIDDEHFSETIQNAEHTGGGQSKLNYNLAWAKTYLKRAAAIENSGRGVWAITAYGDTLFEKDVFKIPARVRREDYEKRKERGPAITFDDASPPSQSNGAEAELAEAENWRIQLLKVLRSIPADAFERLAQRLLREAGFIRVEVTGKSGDGGRVEGGVSRWRACNRPD